MATVTATESLGELTTAELRTLRAEVYGLLREQERRLYAVPGLGLERSRDETRQFLHHIDDVLSGRGA